MKIFLYGMVIVLLLNDVDGGNFKARIGNTTYLVGVFFNKAKKVTIEDRMKNLICQEVTAGNF